MLFIVISTVLVNIHAATNEKRRKINTNFMMVTVLQQSMMFRCMSILEGMPNCEIPMGDMNVEIKR